MLGPCQDVLANDELRGKVRDYGDRFAGPGKGPRQGFGKEFAASGCEPVCSRLQPQVGKKCGARVRTLSRSGEGPESLNRIVGYNLRVARCPQLVGQDGEERLCGNRAENYLGKLEISHISREDELRLQWFRRLQSLP